MDPPLHNLINYYQSIPRTRNIRQIQKTELRLRLESLSKHGAIVEEEKIEKSTKKFDKIKEAKDDPQSVLINFRNHMLYNEREDKRKKGKMFFNELWGRKYSKELLGKTVQFQMLQQKKKALLLKLNQMNPKNKPNLQILPKINRTSSNSAITTKKITKKLFSLLLIGEPEEKIPKSESMTNFFSPPLSQAPSFFLSTRSSKSIFSYLLIVKSPKKNKNTQINLSALGSNINSLNASILTMRNECCKLNEENNVLKNEIKSCKELKYQIIPKKRTKISFDAALANENLINFLANRFNRNKKIASQFQKANNYQILKNKNNLIIEQNQLYYQILKKIQKFI